MLHMFKCVLGTCVRVLNWGVLISLGLSMLRLLAGFTLSALACSSLLHQASPRLSLLLVSNTHEMTVNICTSVHTLSTVLVRVFDRWA